MNKKNFVKKYFSFSNNETVTFLPLLPFFIQANQMNKMYHKFLSIVQI